MNSFYHPIPNPPKIRKLDQETRKLGTVNSSQLELVVFCEAKNSVSRRTRRSSKINHFKKLAINELVSVSFAEILAENDISANELEGSQACAHSCYQNGTEVKKLLYKQRSER